MEDQEGVTQSDSPADVQAPTDRPIQNLKGEFDRKFGALQQQLNTVIEHLSASQTPQTPSTPAPAGTKPHMSDDELWELAKAGDKAAFDLHQERKAAKVYQELRGRENHDSLVTGQLSILHQKYPILADPNNQLAQTRNTAYSLLVKRGYPAGEATLLEATKTAIADRPDVIAEFYTQGTRAREGARRVSAGNAGVTGATYRNDDPTKPEKMKVSSDESRLAQRMGIKDPAKAKARFLERRASGQSSFGAVGNHLDEGEF